MTAEQDGDGTILLFLLCLMQLQYQVDTRVVSCADGVERCIGDGDGSSGCHLAKMM